MWAKRIELLDSWNSLPTATTTAKRNNTVKNRKGSRRKVGELSEWDARTEGQTDTRAVLQNC
jgi:hypothetical protein